MEASDVLKKERFPREKDFSPTGWSRGWSINSHQPHLQCDLPACSSVPGPPPKRGWGGGLGCPFSSPNQDILLNHSAWLLENSRRLHGGYWFYLPPCARGEGQRRGWGVTSTSQHPAWAGGAQHPPHPQGALTEPPPRAGDAQHSLTAHQRGSAPPFFAAKSHGKRGGRRRVSAPPPAPLQSG